MYLAHSVQAFVYKTIALLLIAGGALACVADSDFEPEVIAQNEQAIINGTLNTSDKAVVALVYKGAQFCTGTLVGERTVLTAAHCLPPHIGIPLSGIQVFFGQDVNSGAAMRVVDGIANPAWSSKRTAGDVGVLALKEKAPVDYMPMAFFDVSMAAQSGTEVKAVGFGITSAEGEGNGIRRSGMLKIRYYDASNIYLEPGPSSTCNGDSGGPLLFVQDGIEYLGGIHSRSDCSRSFIAERVDVHAMDFVMPFMEMHEGSASCSDDGMCASNCDSPDPDCPCASDGMCDGMCDYPLADVDCTHECPEDGICDESCLYDLDCHALSADSCNPELEDCEIKVDGGCSTGAGQSGYALSFILLLLMAHFRRDDKTF